MSMMNAHMIKSNTFFILNHAVKYPYMVSQLSKEMIRPQAVEASLGHYHMARVPMPRGVVWMFRDDVDMQTFVRKFL